MALEVLTVCRIRINWSWELFQIWVKGKGHDLALVGSLKKIRDMASLVKLDVIGVASRFSQGPSAAAWMGERMPNLEYHEAYVHNSLRLDES